MHIDYTILIVFTIIYMCKEKSGMYSVVQMIETSQHIHIFSWFKNHVLKKSIVEKLFA